MFVEEYTLPELTVSAGETSYIEFNLADEAGLPVSEATTWTFDIIDYCNRGTPLLTVTDDVSVDSATSATLAVLSLSGTNTVNFSGKYIYMLSAFDSNDEPIMKKKGVIYFLYGI